VRSIPRTRKPFGSPAQNGLNGYGAHEGRLIDTEHDDHPKALGAVPSSRAFKRKARNRAVYFRQFIFVTHAARADTQST
jgi:hypothetical protein